MTYRLFGSVNLPNHTAPEEAVLSDAAFFGHNKDRKCRLRFAFDHEAPEPSPDMSRVIVVLVRLVESRAIGYELERIAICMDSDCMVLRCRSDDAVAAAVDFMQWSVANFKGLRC